MVNYDAMQQRKLPQPKTSDETDYWGGLLGNEGNAATLAHFALPAYCDAKRVRRWSQW